MSAQHRKNRRREKRARKGGTSSPIISRKPPVIHVEPLPIVRHVIDRDLLWCAVQTFPQHENRVSARLKGMGLTVYAPVMEQQRIRRNKPYTLTRYMLPRHIFVGIPKGEHPRSVIGEVQGIHDFFKFCGAIVMFQARDIQRFADAMQDEAEAAIRPKMAPKNGDVMKINSGPFAGFNVLIVGPAADGMIQGEVSVFARTTPVDFHPEQLRSLEAA